MSAASTATTDDSAGFDVRSEICTSSDTVWVRVVERGIFAMSGMVIALLILIFVFLFKEAAPVFLGLTNNARGGQILTLEEAQALPAAKLGAYLGISAEQVVELKDAIPDLVELKAEELKANSNPDSKLNTTTWGMMLFAHQWQGYDSPKHIWQPNSQVEKYNIIPLIVGTLKISFVALLFALPLGILSAIYVSQMAPDSVREIVKPAIEMLAGIPTVVLGFFGLITLATVLQHVFHYDVRLNSFVAGVVVSLAIIPIIFTVAEDSLSSVPYAHKEAAFAMGASNWYAAWHVMLPVAAPGIAAGALLGFGRAVGETMITLLVSGNAFVMGFNFFDSARTIPATIASELAETASGSDHYRILFMIGTLLFIFSFLMNLVGDLIISRLKARIEGVIGAEKSTPEPGDDLIASARHSL